MQDWLVALLELQTLDLELDRIEVTLAEGPKPAAAAKQRWEEANAAVTTAKQAKQAAELEIRRCETEIKTLQTKLADLKHKSQRLMKMEEIQASTLQQEMMNHAISDLENTQLATMEALEKANADIATSEKNVASVLAESGELMQKLRAQKAEAEAKKAELTKQRPALVQNVDPAVLRMYEGVHRKKNSIPGPSVVSLIPGTKDKEPSCGRCHVHSTVQNVSDVRAGRLTQCPSCGAILYQE